MQSPKEAIRVLVVDDHPLLRDGIAATLATQPDITIVGEAADGREAVQLFRSLQPDVTLMDLQMPKADGVEAIVAIREEFPLARIAILTTYRRDIRALHAIKAGAYGYLLKSTLRKELLDAIRAIAAGKRYIPAEIAAELADSLSQESLTPREVQVLQCVAMGKPNKQIAAELMISEDTIKGHLRSIMEKMGASNRTHAVTMGIQRGIITV